MPDWVGPWNLSRYKAVEPEATGTQPSEYWLRYAYDEQVVKDSFEMGKGVYPTGFYTKAAINYMMQTLGVIKDTYDAWSKSDVQYHRVLADSRMTKEKAKPLRREMQKKWTAFDTITRATKPRLMWCIDAWHADGRLTGYEDNEELVLEFCGNEAEHRKCVRDILMTQVGKGYPDVVYHFGHLTKGMREPGDAVMCAQWLADAADDLAKNFWAKSWAEGHHAAVRFDAARMVERAAIYSGEIAFCPQGCLEHLREVCDAARAGRFDVARYDAAADVAGHLTPTIEECAAQHGYFVDSTGRALRKRDDDIAMGKITDVLSVPSALFNKEELAEAEL